MLVFGMYEGTNMVNNFQTKAAIHLLIGQHFPCLIFILLARGQSVLSYLGAETKISFHQQQVQRG
jgi:hypothetical protein